MKTHLIAILASSLTLAAGTALAQNQATQPNDRAFEPRDQVVPLHATVQHPRLQPIGTVPMTSGLGSNVPVMTLDIPALRSNADHRWVMYVTAANEAMAWGDGGISAVSRACGLSRRVIRRGIEELTERRALAAGRIRRPGGGRKAITVTDPALVRTLEAAIADETRGAPQSPLRWTGKHRG